MIIAKDFLVIFMNDGGFPKLIYVDTRKEAEELAKQTFSQHYLIRDLVNNINISESD